MKPKDEHRFDYCGDCLRIVDLSKFPGYHNNKTFLSSFWICGKCGEANDIIINEFLTKKEAKLTVKKEKIQRKLQEKENNKYWRGIKC